ncbi:TonB-linked outer membrane protein, SusC/RagA family [Arachidicoccus rhizosphaerae]|uniref:TonB-linked outer membrane protein, SusC/RagA family n=1 Tax=Arachidicoccus rhizosphaerae TaxID=551991 RepID=A0A1H3ZBB7_9BACT|nr:TonB-dependent receptor [Arachidicoccus rhizosphaerae]SEA20905.1 TonB-linked outer membrane protein, SusC/RagA family [Arachidicoccus rhizosphaerae]
MTKTQKKWRSFLAARNKPLQSVTSKSQPNYSKRLVKAAIGTLCTMGLIGYPCLSAEAHLNFSPDFTKDFKFEAGDYYQQIVAGKVTDTAGAPITGASVLIIGTKEGAITDQDGNYTIKASSGQTLMFKYVGYEQQEIKVTGNHLDVRLVPETSTLDDVVMIGYGTQKKRDLTGAISTVNTEQLKNENPASLQDIMRSNVPGLSVPYSTSAKPSGDFQIRGKNTLNAGATPLIVLDGVIYYGSINDINPDDIASVDVLKDASSVAVYGAKAAEGVIAITTKKGRTGKPTVAVNANFGRATPEINQRPYDVNGYVKFRENVALSQHATTAKPYQYSDPRNLPSDITVDQWLAYDGSKGDPVSIWLERLGMKSVEVNNYLAGRSVDWYDMIINSGNQQNYTASLSGKSDRVSYYWSAGYQDNDGIVYGDRYSIARSRLNLDAKVTDFFSMGMNVGFAVRDESGVAADWNKAITNSPLGSIYTDDSSTLRYSPNDQQGLGQTENVLGAPTYTDRLKKYYTLNANFYGKVKLPFGIQYQVNFTPQYQWYQYYNANSSGFVGSNWEVQGGLAHREHAVTYQWNIDNLLTWNHDFGDHHFEVTLLQNAEKYQYWSDLVDNNGFVPNDDLSYHNIGAGTNAVPSSDDQYGTGQAFMGRLIYAYKQRYMLTASVRRDGYSAFGDKFKWGTFPAVALGWEFTKEPWFKPSWLDYGKLRLSYGVNGNRDIGRYVALSNITTGKYFHVGDDGSVESVSELFVANMANPNLQWERTAAYNVGLDFRLLHGILSGSIDAYKSKTTNLLVKRSLEDIIGFDYIWTNLGQINNQGLEFQLTSQNINRPNFTWSSSFNFSLNRNKIISLYGDKQNIVDANGNVTGQKEPDDITNGWFIGHPLDAIWDYKVLGVYTEAEKDLASKYGQQPGDFKIEDVNGDGKYTNDDKQFLGYKNPRYNLSLRNDFTFLKNFDFSFVLYAKLGAMTTFNNAKNNSGFIDRSSYYDLPYWTVDNQINNYARLFSSDGGASYNVWRSTSFVRLSTISLAYTFPKELIKKAQIKDLRVYFTVRNAALYAPNWDYWDPEMDTPGPSPRNYTLGLNVTL